jgi:glucan phosphoethanolaminetransferase (alkaline phosphatase superfamily)
MAETYDKYIKVKAQNVVLSDLLGTQTQNIDANYATNKSKSLYKTEKVVQLRNYNFILFIIFYICVILLALYFFLLNRTSLSFRMKIALIVFFILYPFIIDYIEQYGYFLYNYIYSYISGVAYIPSLL